MRAITVIVKSCYECAHVRIYNEEIHCSFIESKLDITNRSVCEECPFPSVKEGEKE